MRHGGSEALIPSSSKDEGRAHRVRALLLTSPRTFRHASMIAWAEISMSTIVVAAEVTEMRIIHSPCQLAPPAKQTPSICT